MKTGEKTGKQEDVLRALADYYDERMRIECQIRTALLYPAVLFIVMLTVIFVLLTRVLPVFDSVYVQLGSQLTGIAGGLLLLGSMLKRMMPLMCVFAAFVAVLLVSFVSSAVFREKTLEIWTQYYGSRGISGMMNRARIALVLAMGMESGMNMEDTLSLAAELTQHVPALSRRCISCGRDLAEGMNIMQAFRLYEILPNSECRLLEAGIKSGCGERTMRDIARRLQEDSQMKLQKRLGQAEPAMVLIASVLTGVILLTVMLPLVNIMAAVG
jgi:type IV pilus assembly protein PilC